MVSFIGAFTDDSTTRVLDLIADAQDINRTAALFFQHYRNCVLDVIPVHDPHLLMCFYA